MHLFWDKFIKPVLLVSQDKHLLIEVGSSSGVNTKNLLLYCQETGSRCLAIDPLEIGNINEISSLLAKHGEHIRGLSLDVLPKLPLGTAYLIDGDHNYYTVLNECRSVFKKAQEQGNYSSILFFHDVEWPYARRDLYYNKSNIPAGETHTSSTGGIRQNFTDLIEDGGLNLGMDNALKEGGPKNGVLTGIEDAILEYKTSGDWILEKIPSFFGLGIVYSAKGHSPEKLEEIKKIISVEPALKDYLRQLDSFRIDEVIHFTEKNQSLIKMYGELYENFKLRDQTILELKAELEKLKNPVGGRARLKSIIRAIGPRK